MEEAGVYPSGESHIVHQGEHVGAGKEVADGEECHGHHGGGRGPPLHLDHGEDGGHLALAGPGVDQPKVE